jgi:hypothetical protein
MTLSDPSGSADSPQSIVLDATSITVGGFPLASGAMGLRIEKRTR